VAAQRQLLRVRAVDEVAAHGSVVYLPSLTNASVFEGVSDGEFERMKAVMGGRCGEVYWITRGGNMDCPLPQNAPLVGFSRVMKNEHPGIKSCVVDLDPRFSPLETAASIFEAFASPQLRDEEELVVRRTAEAEGMSPPLVYVPRVAPKKVSADLQRTEQKHYRDCAGLRLEVGTAGLLNTLQWRESQRRAPSKGEVEVQVFATGLNFKDVMLAMGMLSDEAVEGGFCGRNLGIECAGVVAAVGEGVDELTVGQRVVCVARYCFSTYVTTLSPLVQPIPEWMTFEEAATIPATFLTALYALKNLGHIQPGESVLIHAAAGGVGQAAIQLAHLFGAEVYATVGTRDKREFIERELGVHPDRIMNSRNLDFVQEIAQKTNGRGVDLVLNSLSGEALKKSVGVLAPFGRFLEIGKRDIYGNSKLDLLPFGQNLSFFAIDLDRLNGSHPETSGRIFRKLMRLFYDRKLKPLPRKVYSFGRVEEAFRYMQQGKHIGKVILSLQPDEPVRTLLPAFALDPAPIYLLIGGLGGFGTAVAKWMAQHGAVKLAFLSRSGASSPSATQAVEELTALGASVVVEKADVVDHAQLLAALTRIRACFPASSFGGVMQAAMVLGTTYHFTLHCAALSRLMMSLSHPFYMRLSEQLRVDNCVLRVSEANCVLALPLSPPTSVCCCVVVCC
jgi:NADPH:quinone reductase-like Zn-dependent oxidoreductase